MKWENFSLEEFECHCCGDNRIKHSFVDKLQELRTDLGFPFIIISGYRCPQHPVETRKAKVGSHTLGCAADIKVRGKQALEIVSAATSYGFTGVGVKQKGNHRFVHVDEAPCSEGRPRPTIWSY